MAELTLDVARKILDAALAKGVEKKLKPLVITILDARGCVKVTAAQDGTSLMRAEIAHGKAYGALAMGMGSRALFQRAQEQAYFVGAVNALAQGRLVPVPFGLMMDAKTGKIRVRYVDMESEMYQTLSAYMIRLKGEDFDKPETVAALARAGKLDPAEFTRRFGPLVRRA